MDPTVPAEHCMSPACCPQAKSQGSASLKTVDLEHCKASRLPEGKALERQVLALFIHTYCNKASLSLFTLARLATLSCHV